MVCLNIVNPKLLISMNKKNISHGFSHLRGLDSVEFMPYPKVDVPVPEVKSPGEDILDQIYSIDPLLNVPNGTIYQYLSDKTSVEVRDFIEKNILVDLPKTSVEVPDNMREALYDLDSEFIAKTSRNRFETNEDYESRVHGYLQDLRKSLKDESERKNWLDKVRKRYGLNESE